MTRAAEQGGGAPHGEVAFRLLGPLEIAAGNRVLPVPPQKERVLLTALLLRAGRAVPVRELVRMLWDERAPVDPRGAVQKHVMRLRRSLRPTGCCIRTEPEGYRLEVVPETLDLHRFSEQVEQARRTQEAGDAAAASAQLRAALEIWRAVPPLANVLSDALHHEVTPRLVEQYLRAVETRIELDLELGRHDELCAELMELTTAHPLRERFWVQRMRALSAANRQAEALEAYRTIGRLLADELGIDPGPELRELHDRILRGADLVAPAAPAGPGPYLAAVRPRQLPMVAGPLVGRQAAIDTIVDVLRADPAAGRPRLVLVTGEVGVGTTAVAVTAAHRAAAAFPDGQLFVELGGGVPLDVDEAIAFLLHALGVPPAAVPPRRADAVALYRSVTAGRRLLVVLDGAGGSAEAVRALLPGSPSNAAVVTSTRPLPELLVSPGAHHVGLRRLSDDDSRAVVQHMIGQERALADPRTVERIVASAAGLPITLRTEAAQLVTG